MKTDSENTKPNGIAATVQRWFHRFVRYSSSKIKTGDKVECVRTLNIPNLHNQNHLVNRIPECGKIYTVRNIDNTCDNGYGICLHEIHCKKRPDGTEASWNHKGFRKLRWYVN